MNADFWNTRYGEPGFAYGDRPNDYLHSIAARLASRSRVLCLAEGEGRNAAFLASLGHTCVAVDQSIVGLQKAQALAARHGAPLQSMSTDTVRLPFAQPPRRLMPAAVPPAEQANRHAVPTD